MLQLKLQQLTVCGALQYKYKYKLVLRQDKSKQLLCLKGNEKVTESVRNETISWFHAWSDMAAHWDEVDPFISGCKPPSSGCTFEILNYKRLVFAFLRLTVCISMKADLRARSGERCAVLTIYVRVMNIPEA